MLYVIGMGGEPASGKSTVMKLAMESMIGKCVGWHLTKVDGIKVMEHASHPVYVLGPYVEGETFCGTDKLSMSVQPKAEALCARLAQDASKHGIWFEGDRLFNASFIRFLKELPNTNSHFIVLKAQQDVMDARHAARDNQNETWLAGRKTKVQNILAQFDCVVIPNNTEEEKRKAAEHIVMMDNFMRDGYSD